MGILTANGEVSFVLMRSKDAGINPSLKTVTTKNVSKMNGFTMSSNYFVAKKLAKTF